MIVRESYIFTGVEKLPNPSWNQYFSQSIINKEYEVLWDNSTGELIMSNTEFEAQTYAPLFSAIENLLPGANILSIGYGIGYMIPNVRSANVNLTVIENNQDVINLETLNIDDITIIYADAFTADYSTLFPTQRFDLILWDPSSEGNENKLLPKNTLQSLLTTNGKLWMWTYGNCRVCH